MATNLETLGKGIISRLKQIHTDAGEILPDVHNIGEFRDGKGRLKVETRVFEGKNWSSYAITLKNGESDPGLELTVIPPQENIPRMKVDYWRIKPGRNAGQTLLATSDLESILSAQEKLGRMDPSYPKTLIQNYDEARRLGAKHINFWFDVFGELGQAASLSPTIAKAFTAVLDQAVQKQTFSIKKQ